MAEITNNCVGDVLKENSQMLNIQYASGFL